MHPPSISPTGPPLPADSDQAALRHPEKTIYRCFLPDLTGFHSILPRRTQSSTPLNKDGSRQAQGLGRGFSPAIADCGYRAPLAPRLARPNLILSYRYFIVKHNTRHCAAMRCRCRTKIVIASSRRRDGNPTCPYNCFPLCHQTFYQAYS